MARHRALGYAGPVTPGRLLRPLAPLLAFFGGGLLLFLASRAALALLYRERLAAVDGAARLFVVGLVLDVSLLSIVLAPATLALLLLPAGAARRVVAPYLATAAAIMVFLEIAAVPFLAQYDSRPNRIFLDYLRYPREVLATVWAEQRVAVLVAAVLVAATWWAVRRAVDRGLRAAPAWSIPARLAILPLLAALLFIGMRGTIGPRAVNLSTASFSADHLANEIALDSSYSLGYALYSRRHEVDGAALYGAMPRDEMLERVRADMGLDAGAFPDPAIPLLHEQRARVPRARPYSLVIVLEESLGAEFVGTLGGLPLTPRFDALAREGLFLTALYATGTRTVRGIEATIAGFLPSAGSAVVKLGLAQHDFFTIAALLRQHGYTTEFMYGGRSNFDDMRSFMLGNGFDRVLDEPSFTDVRFRGIWGVSDEDLFRRAHETFVAHGDAPFFAVILTTSNHDPFEYPVGRIALFEQPANTRTNAIKYADWALGEFFATARRAAYFDRTVFLVVADHDTRVYGAGLVPVEKFHVPGLILGAGVPAGRIDAVASQVDLPPTLLDLIGLDCAHPMAGRDLLQTPAGTPGHAFLQYDLTNAYRVDDTVVVHAPYQPPAQFTVRDGRLVEAPLDPELARDALAYLQLPEMLYLQRAYRLPGAR